MSKKMFKRSLALGALMAFVITGSAMAGEVVTVYPKMPNCVYPYFNESETIRVLGDNGLQSDSVLSRDYALVEDTNDEAANEAKGYRYNPSPEHPDTYLFELNSNTLTVPGVISVLGTDVFDINGGTLIINGKDNFGLCGRGTVDVDNLIINKGCLYISGEVAMTVTTKSVYIGNGSYGMNVQGDISKNQTRGKITVVTDDLTLENCSSYAFRTAHIGTLDVKTDKISITGDKQTLSKATGQSNIILSAKQGTMNCDFLAGEKGTEKGTVNMTLGSGVNWTGKIATDSATASQGIVDLSGTWKLTEASSLTEANFREGSNLVLPGDGTQYTEKGVYALNGVGDKATLTVEEGAKLKINGITETTYNIAQGFTNLKDAEGKWELSDINTLMQGVAWTSEEGLQVKVFAKDGGDIAEDLGVSETTGDFLSNLAKDAGTAGEVEKGSAEDKLVGLANAAANSQNDKVIAKAAAQAVEAVQKMAEAGGNSATAANVVTNVTNVTGQRLSFSGGNAGSNKGGHGVGLLEEGSGAAIWAQYVHGKDSVENMPSEAGASSYEGQYNGIVMGVDFKKVGKFQSGIAFNYGEGDTNSVNTTSPTRSEYDFWGIGYYGNIRNADSNVIFDIGYAKTDSDVTSNVVIGTHNDTFEASPETTTWTAGVKVEKLYQNNNVQIVPYTGLRYMSIDPEDYSTKCGAMGYKMERQDIWLLPVGVSIKQEIVNPNGWVVTPKVDLSYIWAFGDTDSTMETNTVFGTDNRPVGYDVMDDGSWMGLVGVEAAMDDWTFGVSYSYQKGDHSESKKWYVDAKYSF